MTKVPRILVCLLLIVTLVGGLVGCGKPAANSDPIGAAKPDDRPELAAVLKAFEKEDVNMRSTLEELARMVRSGMSEDAVSGLGKLLLNPSLRPEQKQALENLIVSLKNSVPRK